MSVWFIALALKFALLPVLAFLYWLIPVKGGEWLAKLIPSPKWREILTRKRYDLSWRQSRQETCQVPRQPPAEHPESRDGRSR